MKNVILKNITDKADKLAIEYNKTKDPKLKAQWFSLVSSVEPLLYRKQILDTTLKTLLDQQQKHHH
tara:strand:- start:345 stop:542 length:198 start_codon:yes stop_codon:yes gene_type:complete